MSSPSQYIADRFPWLTRARAVAGAFGIALLIIFIWPDARVVTDLVIVTAIPGTIGAIVFGLTFWSKARVQIGRRQLRYKAVRQVAGIVALACLPFILMQRASIYLRGPRVVASESPEAYPNMKQWRMRVVVAIAHLEGDDGKQLEGRLRDALADLDRRLSITPIILNRTIAVSGRPQGIAHLDALGAVTDVRVEALIWGGAKGVAQPAVGPLYETMFGSDAQFGGAYLPGDFKLPGLPVDDLCTVLRLIAATQSAEFMQQWDYKFGDALEPLIKQVRAIADDSRKTSGWTADTRARVNLAVGIASSISGIELDSEDSLHTAIAYFQRTQADWTRERDPLEWAMAQQNLGLAQRSLAGQNLQVAPLQAAATAYQNALGVYQSRSDRLDSANMQYALGLTFERIGRHETGVESLRKAEDYYRAAVNGFDARYYPTSWGEAQLNLGNTLRVLAHRDGSTKELEDSIAADQEALKVYHKSSEPIYWASAQGQLAQSLDTLGEMTSNRDDFKQSIALFRQILDGYPRERDPLVWAEVQINLGGALMDLYDLDPDSERNCLEPAARAFRTSLEVLSLEHQPTSWAIAKTGLGNALLSLGENGSDTYYAEQAIDAFKDTLKVYKPDRQPIEWATAKYDMGDALVELGERGAGVRYLEEAVDNYREALTVLSKDKSPDLWGKIQHSLKIALDDLHLRGWKGG
ncbi:hypothetical protein [Candidatus Binatus sp.]|uniref:hypothetical protein n=1 Tax=Candidatus Binatus sp. TaxID=2811406 RepID=UPI002F9365AF